MFGYWILPFETQNAAVAAAISVGMSLGSIVVIEDTTVTDKTAPGMSLGRVVNIIDTTIA